MKKYANSQPILVLASFMEK